jgi:signal peptidase I
MPDMTKKSQQAKSAKASEKAAAKDESRDPAEVRAEQFRVAAQRETVEAFVVAFILALLFRAFLAEAFVIPTGSMAPTLMGAHKDLDCQRCQTRFQVGASRERSGTETNLVVVAGICPNCRYANSLDLKDDSDHATFNGDRILVSKFTYALSDPERWDVIVFKYPGNPKQNYIKRLVGLPNETLTLRHGDVYARPTGTQERDVILRKTPSKLLAMRQLVHDTDHQSQVLIDANYPSRWQPWAENTTAPPTDSWKIQRSSDEFVASIESADPNRFQWMRYFHRWPSDDDWKVAQEGGSLADVNPYSSRAITDFYSYDSYVHVPASYIYDSRPSARSGSRLERLLNGGFSKGVFSRRYESGGDPEQFDGVSEWGGQDGGRQGAGRDGMHLVGDLIFETDVETSSDASELMLELVEAGVKYRCRIDLNSGQATLSIVDIETRSFDNAGGEQPTAQQPTAQQPTAQCGVLAGSRHHLRFSNCDDQLLLWVDGDVVAFDRPTTFDSRQFRQDDENYPQYLDSHPLDAAPAAIAIRGGSGTIRNLRVDRDKYYIATRNSNFGIYDYDMNKLWRLTGQQFTFKAIQDVFAMPDRWAESVIWQIRRQVSFELQEDQFFPMGDNSPESLDARCWAGSKNRIPLPRGVNRDAWQWSDKSYVPRDLLVGKALVVFWPHSWNSPLPFTPNFSRMKLIR